ncbi:hypothetical protein [Paenibacillus sp. NPDC058071]
MSLRRRFFFLTTEDQNRLLRKTRLEVNLSDVIAVAGAAHGNIILVAIGL